MIEFLLHSELLARYAFVREARVSQSDLHATDLTGAALQLLLAR